MTATRQDAWSEDDDLLLAEVILRHIREGSTQLAAFEEVGYKLGRTPAACGFRWNSTVRKKYDSAIQIAKAQRQQLKAKGKKRYHTGVEGDSARIKDLQGASNTELSAETVGVKPVSKGMSTHEASEDSLTFDDVIRFIRKQKEEFKQLRQADKHIKEKDEELKRLREENEDLKKELKSVQNVHEDYQALLKIMDRARKLAFLADEETEDKLSFKMDKNGNLERVEKE